MSTPTERRLARLAEQEAELIAAAEGKLTSEETKSVSNPTQSEPEEIKEPSEMESVSTAEQEVQKSEVTQDLDYWKKRALDAEYRFGKYKASTDTTIYKLRTEVKDLQASKVSLMEKVSGLERSLATATPEPELFQKEVVDVLGTQTVDAIKNVIDRTKAEAQKTQERLDAQQLETERSKQRDAESQSYESFVTSLEFYVPDCRAMNVDPKFIDWLQLPDATGTKRIDRLRAAQTTGDVERAAQFFNSYKQTLETVQPKRKDSIANRVGPTQRSSSTSEVKVSDDTITTSFIRDHQSKVSKGYYKGRRSEQLEVDKRIEAAFLAGKILDK